MKVKERIDRNRREVTIRENDLVLLSTKNLIEDKLESPYVGVFKVKKVTGTTVELGLPGTKTFPKFHASLVKKALPGTKMVIVTNK